MEGPELSAEDAQYRDGGSSTGQKLCLEAACTLMRGHLFGKDLSHSSWDFLKTSQGKFQDSRFSKGGRARFSPAGFHFSARFPAWAGFAQSMRAFYANVTTQCQHTPDSSWEGTHTSGFPVFSSQHQLFPPDSPPPPPEEDEGKTPAPPLCRVSCAHPSRRTESTRKPFQKGFYWYRGACPLFLLLAGTPGRATARGRAGLAQNWKRWPLLRHSLRKLVWKTIKLSEQKLNQNVCCDSVTFLLAQRNQTRCAVHRAEHPFAGFGSRRSKYSCFGVASLRFAGNLHVLETAGTAVRPRLVCCCPRRCDNRRKTSKSYFCFSLKNERKYLL